MGIEVVRLSDVSKIFTVRTQKSLKDSLINALVRRHHDEEFRALDHVDLSINAGESLGLVGPNGSGKSTMLKVIGGILVPNGGKVQVRGRLAAMIELGAGFHQDLTGRENVFLNAAILGLSKTVTQSYLDSIVEFSGISEFIDTQVKFYSSGMYVRLAFAVAVHVDPDVLLVDEVLAVGDEPFQVKCMEKIHQFQQEGRTIVLVSHSAAQVLQVCDRAVVLDHGRVKLDGSPELALSELQDHYQTMIEADAEAASRAHSTYDAKIVDLWFGDGTLAPETQIELNTGDAIVIGGQLEFAHPVPGWKLLVRVENSLGMHFIQVDSEANLAQTLPCTEHARFSLELPDNRLPSGDYLLSVFVYDANGVQLDGRVRELPLRVTTGQRSTGPVYSDATLTFS
ncbi:MAG: ATP-binding cassette domain-containing protein [Propionibacteriaceae bacterium]|jgi:ABC-2 type transport system ATP-binding protein|nr:ATP-binding cassette domain-containing protein [Propionibacteriaceae bacterium]